MIYLISFIEALATGLTGINLALYLKCVIKVTELQSAQIMSTFGIISSILTLVLGSLIDRFGVKRCAFIGTIFLMLGRLLLGNSATVSFTIIALGFTAIGSAIKSGSLIVFLKQYNKSFKLDYVIFNLAYCIAGFLFDCIKNYSLIYTVSGIFMILNLIALSFLPKDKFKQSKKKVMSYKWRVLKKVGLYTIIMMPVSFIFTFMSNFIPKASLHLLGPDAPIGKLYGSLNPFIILFTVPLFSYIGKRYNLSTYKTAIIGTLISALSLIAIVLSQSYFIAVITVVILFTIGEAIWSPANMELSAKICPKGEEGKYMTLALIPRTLGGVFMNYFISYNLTNFIYTNTHITYPFLFMGLIALVTPIVLTLRSQTDNI